MEQPLSDNRRRIFFYAEITLPLILIALIIWWAFYREESKEVAEEGAKKEEVVEFQDQVEKLREIEEQIAATQKELEELSSLSPEEKARREEEREILSATRVSDDVAIVGVEVKIQGGKKIITNRAEGYRIEASQNWVIARSITSDWLELHDQNAMCLDPDCDPVMRVRTTEANPDKLSIGEWLAQEEEKAGAKIYSPREPATIKGETAYRIKEEIPARFEGYYYYWSMGTKIYDIRISLADDEIYHSVIESFSFVQAP